MGASESWAGAAIVASIAFSSAAYYIATALFAHRERMAKIQQGIDPDQKHRPNRLRSDTVEPPSAGA